jgi:hypothetical protein
MALDKGLFTIFIIFKLLTRTIPWVGGAKQQKFSAAISEGVTGVVPSKAEHTKTGWCTAHVGGGSKTGVRTQKMGAYGSDDTVGSWE